MAAWAVHALAVALVPQPFAPPGPQPQVAKFCAEQADACAEGPGGGGSARDRRMLWAVLRVLAEHQGKASSAPYSLLPSPAPAPAGALAVLGSGKQKDPAALPERQLAEALLEGVGPSPGDAQLLLPGAVPPAHASAAAAEVQQLLLGGQRAEALRCAAPHAALCAALCAALIAEQHLPSVQLGPAKAAAGH